MRIVATLLLASVLASGAGAQSAIGHPWLVNTLVQPAAVALQESWVARVVGQHKSVAEKTLGPGNELKGVGYYDSLAKQVRRLGESFAGYSMDGLKGITIGYGFTEKDYGGEFQVLLLNVYFSNSPATWQEALGAVNLPTKGVVFRNRTITDLNHEVDLKSIPGLPNDWYAVFQNSTAGASLHFVHPEFQSDAVKAWVKAAESSASASAVPPKTGTGTKPNEASSQGNGTNPGDKALQISLTDKHKYLSVLGKTPAEATKILGQPAKITNDGESWSYMNYAVTPFSWFAVRTLWDKAGKNETDPSEQERLRKLRNQVSIRVQVKEMSLDKLFDELGLSFSEWTELPKDSPNSVVRKFTAGQFVISVSGKSLLDVNLYRK